MIASTDHTFHLLLTQMRDEKLNYETSPHLKKIDNLSVMLISFYDYMSEHQPKGKNLPKIHKIQSDFVLMACLENELNALKDLSIDGVNLLYSQLSFFNYLKNPRSSQLIKELSTSIPSPKITQVLQHVICSLNTLKHNYLKTLSTLEALKMLNMETNYTKLNKKIKQLTSQNLDTLFSHGKVLIPLGWSLPKPFSGHHFYGLLSLTTSLENPNLFNLRIDLINSKISSTDIGKQNISMAFEIEKVPIETIEEVIRAKLQGFLTMHLPKINVKKACKAYKTTEENLAEINLEQEFTKYIYSAINDISIKIIEPNNRYRRLQMVPSKACTTTTLMPLLLVISNGFLNASKINLTKSEKKYLKFCFEDLLYDFKNHLLLQFNLQQSLKFQSIPHRTIYQVTEVLNRTFTEKSNILQHKFHVLLDKNYHENEANIHQTEMIPKFS